MVQDQYIPRRSCAVHSSANNCYGETIPPAASKEVGRRRAEEGSAERGAGSPESGRGAPGVFGDLTSQAIVGGDPLRLTRVASPNQIGAPAPPRQPPRLRDATVEPIVGASYHADHMRISGVRSQRVPLPPLDAPTYFVGIWPRRRAGLFRSRASVRSAAWDLR